MEGFLSLFFLAAFVVFIGNFAHEAGKEVKEKEIIKQCVELGSFRSIDDSKIVEFTCQRSDKNGIQNK